MVRVAGLTSCSAAESRCARRTDASAADPDRGRARVLELDAGTADLGRRVVSGARGRGHRITTSRRSRRPSTRSSSMLRDGHLPGADAARRRSGAAVPVRLGAIVSLAVFVRDPESGQERFARVEGAGGPAALPLRPRPRPVCAARAGALALPADALPGDGDRRAVGVPRHARRRPRGLGRGGRPARGRRARAAPATLRRGDAARGFERHVPCAAGAPSARSARWRTSSSIRSTARIDLEDAWELSRLDRSDLVPTTPGPGGAPALRRCGRGRPVRGDPVRRPARPPPLRLVRGELRVVPEHAAPPIRT